MFYCALFSIAEMGIYVHECVYVFSFFPSFCLCLSVSVLVCHSDLFLTSDTAKLP